MLDLPNIHVKKIGCVRLLLAYVWELQNKICILKGKKAQDASSSCKCGSLCVPGKDTCGELGRQSSSTWHSRTQYSCQNSSPGKGEKEKQEETRRDRGKRLISNSARLEKLESQIIVIPSLCELGFALFVVEERLMLPSFCVCESLSVWKKLLPAENISFVQALCALPVVLPGYCRALSHICCSLCQDRLVLFSQNFICLCFLMLSSVSGFKRIDKICVLLQQN